MIAWWLLASFCLLVTNCEPIAFDPLFSQASSFFATEEEPTFGAFSGYTFDSPTGVELTSNFEIPFASETDTIPIYTDGAATPPQVTLSYLEKDFKTHLHRLTNERLGPRPRHRIPKFVSEPFPSASDKDERRPGASRQRSTEESRFVLAKKSQPVEIHTGFVPIIKGSSNDRRNKNLASTVIKDIEPPILTAAPGSLTARPTLYNVAASVLSSSRIPSSSAPNSSAISANELRSRASYSRLLNVQNDSKVLFSAPSSSSERVIFHAEAAQNKDPQQVSASGRSSDFSDIKVTAQKTFDVNCDGSSDLGWCELGEKYPRKYVNQVISSCPAVVERLHVEIPHVFEKLSDASDFKAELDNSTQRSAKERSNHDAWSWAAYVHQGSLCDAERGFLRPETAKDTAGTWNIVIQTDTIKQRVPIEMCRQSNSPCKKVASCGLKSQCLQKYNYHLLMSLNPTQKHDCPFMKLYRFPSACVCHVE